MSQHSHGFPNLEGLELRRSASIDNIEVAGDDDLYADKEDSKQRLLSGNDDGVLENTTKPHLTNWRLFIVLCGFIIAGCGLVVLVVLGFSQEVKVAKHEVAEALAVHTNDYVLDPDWDFDAPPQRREYTWTIRDRFHNPDGVYRPMILANNMFPGPLVEANDGDTIIVHVENRAINATSIHWHGLYQNGTPWMDGTVGVTQCPIAPGSSFTYEFTIKGQHGTTWWHGHQGVQTSDGLHGPIVIHSPKEKELQRISYATDRVILLSDHYHDLSSALMFQYLMPDAENAEPVPESALINGHGIRDCDQFPHRKCDNTTSNVGIPEFHLEPEHAHRLRLVNVGAFAEFQFEIDNHELAVTEVDGTDVQPQYVHRLNINTAQRYSVVVTANQTTSSSFWMRARMIPGCFTDPPSTLQADALAVVRYDDDSGNMPNTRDWQETLAQECRDMNTTGLVPVDPITPPEPDVTFYLRSNFEIGAYRLSRGFFNTSSWRANVASPALIRVMEGLIHGNESFRSNRHSSDDAFVNSAAFDSEYPYNFELRDEVDQAILSILLTALTDDRELVIQTTGRQTIDILVSNFDDGNHPLHLHGYKYFVLAQGHGAPPLTRIDAAINKESLAPLYADLDTSNPLRRDTASVEAFGWVLLRVVADNPGLWAFHCHVAWHAEAGLMMQFLTNSDGLAEMQIPQSSLDLCKATGLDTGMAPDDTVYEDFAK